MILTRAQVEALTPLAMYDVEQVNIDSGCIGVYSALALMIAHDAALRQQLAERDETIARLVKAYYREGQFELEWVMNDAKHAIAQQETK